MPTWPSLPKHVRKWPLNRIKHKVWYFLSLFVITVKLSKIWYPAGEEETGFSAVVKAQTQQPFHPFGKFWSTTNVGCLMKILSPVAQCFGQSKLHILAQYQENANLFYLALWRDLRQVGVWSCPILFCMWKKSQIWQRAHLCILQQVIKFLVSIFLVSDLLRICQFIN